jgi:hypothetical protein
MARFRPNTAQRRTCKTRPLSDGGEAITRAQTAASVPSLSIRQVNYGESVTKNQRSAATGFFQRASYNSPLLAPTNTHHETESDCA